MNVSLDNLANEITKAIQEYTEDVSEAIEAKVDEVADKVRAEASTLAPKRTGKYARGFKVTKDGNSGRVRRIIWNKKHYMLVHLLEFGHALRNGGRARAFPHMQPAYEKHGAELPDHIKRIIKNGGGR